jgi:hypothetical protein
MDEIIKVGRPVRSHIFHGLWMVFTLYSTLDSVPPAKYVWGLLFASSIALLLRVILKRNYMELRGSKLFVYGDFFNTQTTDISDIERIEIAPGPLAIQRSS